MIVVNIRCNFFWERGAISCFLGMKLQICYIKMILNILRIK